MEEKPKKEQLLDILQEMIDSYERLPNDAKISPPTHYDVISILFLMKELFKVV